MLALRFDERTGARRHAERERDCQEPEGRRLQPHGAKRLLRRDLVEAREDGGARHRLCAQKSEKRASQTANSRAKRQKDGESRLGPGKRIWRGHGGKPGRKSWRGHGRGVSSPRRRVDAHPLEALVGEIEGEQQVCRSSERHLRRGAAAGAVQRQRAPIPRGAHHRVDGVAQQHVPKMGGHVGGRVVRRIDGAQRRVRRSHKDVRSALHKEEEPALLQLEAGQVQRKETQRSDEPPAADAPACPMGLLAAMGGVDSLTEA